MTLTLSKLILFLHLADPCPGLELKEMSIQLVSVGKLSLSFHLNHKFI